MVLMCRSRSLIYGYCIRSWRLLCHSGNSPYPLSSLKGFTPELLKVLCVCTHTIAARSAWSSVEERRLLIGIGSSNTLGLLQRSLVVTFLFVPRRNRRVYCGYVFQPSNVAIFEWDCQRPIAFFFSQVGLVQCYVKSTNKQS